MNTGKGNVLERRKSPRLKDNFSIEINHLKAKVAADTLNISSSGVYCQSSKSIPLFREIQMSIKLKGITKSIDCSGVVVRNEKIHGKSGYNIAIFFQDIDPDDKKILAKYIENKIKEGD